MGRTDLFVSGWDISPEDVAICRASEDGSSICLGEGQFGKARGQPTSLGRLEGGPRHVLCFAGCFAG
jgi:hypothetical protein